MSSDNTTGIPGPAGGTESGDFDPAQVFCDPVEYLRSLGMIAELVEGGSSEVGLAA